ncbi:hypothetical protein WJX73_010019 [Symbiochloris irregularis]|uniref:GST C-terminal domain-containing protein n=1 Tax=Symbiochloris irregularis TaxID=706552 RepID=A0AAW1PBI8_9CHLO
MYSPVLNSATQGLASHACFASLPRLSYGSSDPSSGRRNLRRSKQRVTPCRNSASEKSDKGFGLLEWTGTLIPQSLLVKGAKGGWRLAWQTMMKELAPQTADGAYARPSYQFNSGQLTQQLREDSGRYHIYVGNACPWCHRVSLAVLLRGLAPHVGVTQAIDDAERASRGGWVFNTPEPIYGATDLRGVYQAAQPGFRGRCTAPLLLDIRDRKIVSNESSEIVRLLNGLHLPGCTPVDLVPRDLEAEMERLNALIHDQVNNGVYKSGFCTSQVAYERAQRELYSTLDSLEQRLAKHRFLLGDRFTEADLRLFPTMIRYDAVYTTLFKCCRHRLKDYPNLHAWTKDVYQISVGSEPHAQVRNSIDIDDARRSYFENLFPLNPGGIIPSASHEFAQAGDLLANSITEGN